MIDELPSRTMTTQPPGGRVADSSFQAAIARSSSIHHRTHRRSTSFGEPMDANRTYKANLQRTGALVDETIALLHEYARLGEWAPVRQAALHTNLLGKGATKTVSELLFVVQRRLLTARPGFPSIDCLASAIAGDWPETAKAQVLLPYTCAEDALVDAAVRKLVAERLDSNGLPEFTPDRFTAFLDEKAETHPEVGRWSETVHSRWLSSFRSLLRAYGFMERHPSLRLTRPVVRVEAFAFHAIGLKEAGVPTVDLLVHPRWELYALRERDKEMLLTEGQA
jgi:hypothetical protein